MVAVSVELTAEEISQPSTALHAHMRSVAGMTDSGVELSIGSTLS